VVGLVGLSLWKREGISLVKLGKGCTRGWTCGGGSVVVLVEEGVVLVEGVVVEGVGVVEEGVVEEGVVEEGVVVEEVVERVVEFPS
jgi:hypothetical protein